MCVLERRIFDSSNAGPIRNELELSTPYFIDARRASRDHAPAVRDILCDSQLAPYRNRSIAASDFPHNYLKILASSFHASPCAPSALTT